MVSLNSGAVVISSNVAMEVHKTESVRNLLTLEEPQHAAMVSEGSTSRFSKSEESVITVMHTPSRDEDTPVQEESPLRDAQHTDEVFSTYQLDHFYEEIRSMRRNKRMLMARLVEVAPRGRLSLINLCRRGIGKQEAELLKEAILMNPQLYVLRLSYNELGDEGASILSTAIFQNNQHHQLSVLDLGFNSIGDKGCGALAVHVLAGNYNLRTLYLSGNAFGEKGALAIAGGILHGNGLRTLHLSANHLGSTGMKAIAGAIAKNDSRITETVNSNFNTERLRRLEELHLGCASIGSEGFFTIPGMMLSNTSLKTLDVSNNELDDRDISLLSQALAQNKLIPLETLRLSFNEITCQGVESLMNAIWGSQTLREMKLDNNKIKDRGAQLCAVVLTSVALEQLDLSFNKVSTAGIKTLMKNLSESTSLLSLGLSGIPIDQNASKAVSYALAYNTSLKALYLDNCSTGFASHRHIVAGAVSNRNSSLRVLTGFAIGPIAMSLGMPRLPKDWSNDQVLGFFRLMWQQWLLKARNGRGGEEDAVRGPAPPAAVAAAAKISFSSLGSSPENLFRTEPHEKPLSERAPVEPAGAALLERTLSGTMSIPLFTVSSETKIDDFVDGESKIAALAISSPSVDLQISTVRSPLENLERRNKNLQWLRLHFRSLSDVGRLPFNNADLWQLHQYYFSPPPVEYDQSVIDTPAKSNEGVAPPPPTPIPTTPTLAATPTHTFPDGVVSFQTLGLALSQSLMEESSHSLKRPSSPNDEVERGSHVNKKPKTLKPRIAYYPRIMAHLQSLGTKPQEQMIALLRQLKYTESILFAGKNPYSEHFGREPDEPSHADVDMILLDLL